MSIEAMKQALEALELARTCIEIDSIDIEAEQASDALRQAIAEAEKQQPFGYLRQTSSLTNPPHGWAFHFSSGEVPLYTHPPQRSEDTKQPKAEQEPPEWMMPDVLCDRACLYACTQGFTHFPACATKREWVGLTDRDIEAIWGEDVSLMYSGHYDAIRAIEAKLKEKNT